MVARRPHKPKVTGSSPVPATAWIAQLAEQGTCNSQVVGSMPSSGTTFAGGHSLVGKAPDCDSGSLGFDPRYSPQIQMRPQNVAATKLF